MSSTNSVENVYHEQFNKKSNTLHHISMNGRAGYIMISSMVGLSVCVFSCWTPFWASAGTTSATDTAPYYHGLYADCQCGEIVIGENETHLKVSQILTYIGVVLMPISLLLTLSYLYFGIVSKTTTLSAMLFFNILCVLVLGSIVIIQYTYYGGLMISYYAELASLLSLSGCLVLSCYQKYVTTSNSDVVVA